ncbi:substrate-binding domain-containing protein [Desulforegula conservatrix]|uniref:substrate-binding domain-containing protein n=1 Tax=Desulforegula conservatrix TaxID=153026 RepID=UPI0003F59C45|nr:substrate-binding domain-containing protein [Desulforegula conservatrix]
MKKSSFQTVFRIMIILMTVLSPSLLLAGEIIVIANKNVPDSQLTKDEVKAIFLGEKTKWSNDSKVSFVVLKTPEDQEKFMKDYVGKSPSQFNNFWKQQVFTGKGKMPEAFDDVKALLDYVAKTDGAIAYISSDAPAGNVKKVEVK